LYNEELDRISLGLEFQAQVLPKDGEDGGAGVITTLPILGLHGESRIRTPFDANVEIAHESCSINYDTPEKARQSRRQGTDRCADKRQPVRSQVESSAQAHRVYGEWVNRIRWNAGAIL
jgi:hypothetical protein